MFAENLGGDGTYKARIQTAGEQKAQGRIRIQALIYTEYQLFADPRADLVQIPVDIGIDRGEVGIADKFSILPVVSRREGFDLGAEPHQVLGLTCKDHAAVGELSIKQRANTDRVAGGDEAVRFGIIEDHGKLRVQLFEHLNPVPVVKRQDDLAVGIALKDIALILQLFFQRPEEVQLTVADAHISLEMKGLHPFLMQAHDGKAVETEIPFPGLLHAAHIRAAGDRALKKRHKLLRRQCTGREAHNRTHDDSPICCIDTRAGNPYSTSCRASYPSSPVRTFTTFSTS